MNLERPHRRLNMLTGQWVLVSPHRAKRPWLGQAEKVADDVLPSYDPSCYLCPGNNRSNGKFKNPDYTDTFVFENDFAALLYPEIGDEQLSDPNPMFVTEAENGICRVVCFSPQHDKTLPELNQKQVEAVIQTWTEQTIDLAKNDFIRYVQVFENKGAVMGCSQPHPHSQIWATSHIPNEPAVELMRQETYLNETGRCLLCDYLDAERKSNERIIASNEHFSAMVPFWAVWPFEVMVVAHRHMGGLPDLKPEETAALADIIRQVTIRYDNLFEVSFPYSMGFHQNPCDGEVYAGWHFHAHFYPPLLRSATVRKFMVGFEMLAMPQRDLTPEFAAQRLLALSDVHYKARK
jgi:UDPglucose--hexose-1-phosphate uridylyltransferase